MLKNDIFLVMCCLARQNSVEFSTNIDITSYQDGQRYTHNPEGRAVAQVVWDFFEVRGSARLSAKLDRR